MMGGGGGVGPNMNAHVLIFYWLLSLLVKTDAMTFEFKMTNNSQEIINKHF